MKQTITGNEFTHDGCTTSLPTIGHKGKCLKPWQGEYDSETGTITLSCKCGGVAKIETREHLTRMTVEQANPERDGREG